MFAEKIASTESTNAKMHFKIFAKNNKKITKLMFPHKNGQLCAFKQLPTT